MCNLDWVNKIFPILQPKFLASHASPSICRNVSLFAQGRVAQLLAKVSVLWKITGQENCTKIRTFRHC